LIGEIASNSPARSGMRSIVEVPGSSPGRDSPVVEMSEFDRILNGGSDKFEEVGLFIRRKS